MRRRVLIAAIAGPLLWASGAAAQDSKACRDVSVELDVPDAATTKSPCLNLANFLRVASPAVRAAAALIDQPGARNPATVFSERAFQQKNPSYASLSGSVAQSDAAPSVMPTGVASGSLALVGSDAGDDALAALGLNPVVLFLVDGASQALARYSRFMDLSVFVPVTKQATDTAADGRLKYVGARMRINILGLRDGDHLWEAADSLVDRWLAQGGRDVKKILDALKAAPDLKACARALADTTGAGAAVVTSACGAPLSLGVNAAEADSLGKELSRVRNTLDRRYFGLDVRADWGDPTLGAVENAAGTSVFAGLSYGRDIAGRADGSSNLGLRLRLGARHATLDYNDSTDFAVEGGLGLEFTRSLTESQTISAAAALDFRYGNGNGGSEEQFQTDYTILRSSLVIPMTASNSLSIAVGVPVSGSASPYLSVNFNWGLFLSGNSPLAGT